MNITWINESSTKTTGAFMTARAHREGSGSVRLNLYFSSAAAALLDFKRGERLLVGFDESGTRLYFKPTLYGGNMIKGREADESLQCMVTLPSLHLPAPQAMHEQDLQTTADYFSVPFELAPLGGRIPAPHRQLKAA